MRKEYIDETAQMKKSDRRFSFVTGAVELFVIILIFAGAIGAVTFLAIWEEYYLTDNMITLERTAYEYPESNEKIDSFYSGFYRIYGTVLSDKYDGEDLGIYDVDEDMILLEINLIRFNNKELSENALRQLDDYLTGWENKGKTLILRPLYDWDCKNLETEPKSIDIILRHMEQTAEVINRHKDSVFVVQGLYIGNIGEMNGTKYLTVEDLSALFDKLSDELDEDIFMAVRTPWQWRAIAGRFTPLTEDEWRSGDKLSRLGLFNDGMMGTWNDYGTYGETSIAYADSFFAKGTREEELLFQDELCTYVPSGGEVVISSELNDLNNAVDNFRQMHISYLNNQHDPSVLEKWQNTTYTGSDVFDGMSGYDYIDRHLGSRFVFESYYIPKCDVAQPCETVLTVKNEGFANIYVPVNARYELVGENISETIPVDYDLRTVGGSQEVQLPLTLDVRDLAEGSYDIYFDMTDAVRGDRIALANDAQYTDKGLLIGSVTVTNTMEEWLKANDIGTPEFSFIRKYAKEHEPPEVELPSRLRLPRVIRDYWAWLCDKSMEWGK